MYDSIDILEIDKINITTNLIDIRDKYEYLLGHIPRSINIPYTYIITLPNEYLTLDKTYYIYCDNGIKSKKICAYLHKLGYKVIDLMGGYRKYLEER